MDTSAAKIAALAGEMKLEETARKDASKGKPEVGNPGDSQSDHWEDIRKDIVATVSTAGQGEIEKIQDGISTAKNAISKLGYALSHTHLPKKVGADADPQKLVWGTPNDQFEGAKQKLDEARGGKDEATVNYITFKEAHGLTKDTSGDERSEQLKWLFFIVLVEGVANGVFLKDIASGGWLGGVFLAVVIAFLNVAFAALGGVWGLRYLFHHKDLGKRIAALAWSLGCLMFCLAILAAAASFRGYAGDLLAGGETSIRDIIFDAWEDMVEDFRSKGFEITNLFLSFDSSMLFAAGIICMILGFLKGYQYDGRCPGYGDIARAKNEAEEKYDEARDHVREEYESAYSALKNSHEAMEEKIKKLRATFSNHDFKGQLVSIAQGLLLKYSRRNAELRQDGAPRMPENLFDPKDIESPFQGLQDRYNDLFKSFSDEKIVENSEEEARRFGLIPSKYPGDPRDPGEQS